LIPFGRWFGTIAASGAALIYQMGVEAAGSFTNSSAIREGILSINTSNSFFGSIGIDPEQGFNADASNPYTYVS
jgi:hypothetical protein